MGKQRTDYERKPRLNNTLSNTVEEGTSNQEAETASSDQEKQESRFPKKSLKEIWLH